MSYNIGIETSPVRPASSRNNNSSGEKSSGERPVQRYSAALEEPSVPHDGFWNLTTRGGLLSPRKDQELEQLRVKGCVQRLARLANVAARLCARLIATGAWHCARD